MDFEIPESLIHPLLQLIGADSALGKQLTAYGVCRGNMMVSSEWFDAKSLNTLYLLCKTQNERALMFQMLALDNAYNAPQARVIPSLDKLVPGLVAYLARDVIDGWLYQRHRDGGMADMTVLDYAMMVEDSHVATRIIEYRRRTADSGITGKGGELIAVALTDILSDGLSMVYSFFEPGEESRSLGTFMILDHIARARRLGLPYVYLGYWIEGSRKMDYKARFLPQQRLAPSGWLRIDAGHAGAPEPQD